MSFAKKNLSTRCYKTKTVETADQEVLSFLLIYVLPLITRDLEDFNWIVYLFIVFFYCFVVVSSYGFHFNPLLTSLGYHFYKVTEEDGMPHVLIAKRHIRRTGESLAVGRLGPYLLIEKGVPSSPNRTF